MNGIRNWSKVLVMTGIHAVILVACEDADQRSKSDQDIYKPRPKGKVTFAEDVAPIIFSQCSECHRPGQSAPFSLLSYEDISKRSRQIVEVIESGYMPPWLPDQPRETFINERILSATEMGLIRQWHTDGVPEGNPEKTPAVPEFNDGWKLGPPDLIVRLPQEFEIPAEGPDIYRNFVIPLEEPADEKFVRTVDFRPLNPKVVHHMVLLADITTSSRELDSLDEIPGFPGIMSLSDARLPYGQFHGWTPGKAPYPGTEGIAWPLLAPIDLVLQVHMQTTGKPEKLQVEVGFYFADKPPVFRPYPLVFRNKIIEIPPGEKDYHVKGSFQLPVDAEVISVYPHAHYLAKNLQARAHLADGTSKQLISIPNWDFNWQDEYRFLGNKTVFLPARTIIEFDYTFDNSADNPQNPSSPPTKVFYGQNSTDEMAEFMLQVLTKSSDDLFTLDQAAQFNAIVTEIQALEWKLTSSPNDNNLRNLLATYQIDIGNTSQALAEFEKVLSNPLDAGTNSVDEISYATVTAAQIYYESNQLDRAQELFGKASQLYDNSTNSVEKAQIEFFRGQIASEKGDLKEATGHFRTAVGLQQDFAEAWNALAWMYMEQSSENAGEDAQSLDAARMAVKISNRQYGPYLLTLARVHERQKEWENAIQIYEECLNLAKQLDDPSTSQRIEELIANIRLLHNQP